MAKAKAKAVAKGFKVAVGTFMRFDDKGNPVLMGVEGKRRLVARSEDHIVCVRAGQTEQYRGLKNYYPAETEVWRVVEEREDGSLKVESVVAWQNRTPKSDA